MELQREGLQELIATLKDGRGAEKVAKWQAKMEAVALENVRHKREVERVKDQVSVSYWVFHLASLLAIDVPKYRYYSLMILLDRECLISTGGDN